MCAMMDSAKMLKSDKKKQRGRNKEERLRAWILHEFYHSRLNKYVDSSEKFPEAHNMKTLSIVTATCYMVCPF